VNVAEMRRRYPHHHVAVFNVLDFDSYAAFGSFDIVHCYGLLYHTPKPQEILRGLSQLCRQMILLETCVTPGLHSGVHLTREPDTFDQAIGNVGCRPTRCWIMEQLEALWGHAYVTKTQPRHPDFDLDWDIPFKKLNHRAVFVASREPIDNPLLLKQLPSFQEYA